jgi:hypothetical protein
MTVTERGLALPERGHDEHQEPECSRAIWTDIWAHAGRKQPLGSAQPPAGWKAGTRGVPATLKTGPLRVAGHAEGPVPLAESPVRLRAGPCEPALR